MDKKTQILEAAYQLFSENGYGLSMSEIAWEVGIKTPSIYSHFSGKDEIVEQTIRKEVERYYTHLGNSMAKVHNGKCRDAMKHVYLSIYEYFEDINRLRFWRNIPMIPNEPLRETCRELIEKNDRFYTREMQRCFERGIEKGEIRADVSEGSLYLYLAMIQGVLHGVLLYRQSATRGDYILRVFDAYWNGISATSMDQNG